MNAEVKVKWVAALRSGKYEQGIGRMRRRDPDGKNRFCCLGVLCEILHIPVTFNVNHIGDEAYEYDGELNYPSPSAYEASGITDSEAVTLGLKNDDRQSFSDIADYIEVNL